MNPTPLDIQPYRYLLEEHRERFAQFEKLLVSENKKYNLTRITSTEQVWTRHFLDSLAGLGILDELSKKLGRPLRVLDTGSGAGFPGLVLAMVREEWSIVSLEATEKKVRFQQAACEVLNLKNVQVIHGRAEEAAHQPPFREQFDAVTARALAPLAMLAELTLGFMQKDGCAVYWKGSSGGDEIAAGENAVRQMGGCVEQLFTYALGEGADSLDFSLVVCRKLRETPEQYPRVYGKIKQSPLGTESKS